MSRFSGKCDLYDYMSGMGGWMDENGKPVKMGDPNVRAYYSDEMKDFEEFKKRTGGILHQHHLVKKINPYNADFIAKHCPEFKMITTVVDVPDKRAKSGVRKKTKHTYSYWGKEYTEKEICKKGVFIGIDIRFNTILDLVKYYPYIVTMSAGGKDGTASVWISRESYVEESFQDTIHFGGGSFRDFHNHDLAKHYLELAEEILKDKKERTVEEAIDASKLKKVSEGPDCLTDEQKKLVRDDFYPDKIDWPGSYEYELSSTPDVNFEIEWSWKDGKRIPHWSSPRLISGKRVRISREDVESFLHDEIPSGQAMIKYVKK